MGQQLLLEFVRPVLDLAVQYDRITSFFSTQSLLAIADGIESLRQKKGKMRLVLGIHDVPHELAQAALTNDKNIALLIEMVEERLLQQASTIEDVLVKDRLAAIAWMMKDGLLEVRVAAPIAYQVGGPGIFHNKSFVFRDMSGNVVAAVGSPNETVAGLGNNYEEITVFKSWQDPAGYTKKQMDKFESIWSSSQPGLVVRPLDIEFAERLLATLRPRSVFQDRTPRLDDLLGKILEEAPKMATYEIVSGRSYALFPHQERAYLDALSRRPIRTLLADEVGLGKTIELGAVMEHAIRFRGVKRVVVLAPKAILPQWQEEMSNLFGLKFWIYDSGAKAFYTIKGQTKRKGARPVLSKDSPDLLLISAQYARGQKGKNTLFGEATDWPDFLVVDEAHSARTKPDLAGNRKPTRMWKMLSEITKKVEHLVLLTATPMQLDWQEYHALLDILGLPPKWKKPENYEWSLKLLADRGGPSLASANKLNELLMDVVEHMRPTMGSLTKDEKEYLDELAKASNPVSLAADTQRKWNVALSVFTKFHPAHLLTIRNTKAVLQGLGYQFPERLLESPALPVSDDLHRLNLTIEQYLSRGYFLVERALHPERNFSTGFVLCSYQQRLASSLHACSLSLKRRLKKIINLSLDIPECGEEGFEDDDAEWEEEETDESLITATGVVDDSVQRAINIEQAYIKDILGQLQKVMAHATDPKLTALNSVIEKHLNVKDKVLVFSRYVDTLDAAVTHFTAAGRPTVGFAYYTGQDSWIEMNGDRQPASRETIKKALNKGTVQIIFCSDAASEGLNLQAARVLVNLDVPWNPARLEQRIGRIARLGQKAKEVTVYNLWYPDSIEAKIYGRLIQRRDLFELAVGQFPEIVSQAIKDEVSRKLMPGVFQPEVTWDPIQKLQDARNNIQLYALSRIWKLGASATPISGSFRARLVSLVQESFSCTPGGDGMINCVVNGEEIAMGVKPGDFDCISLVHPVLRFLKTKNLVEGINVDVGMLLGVNSSICFVVRAAGTSWRILRQDALANLLEAIVLGKPFSLRSTTVEIADLTKISLYENNELMEHLSWLPRGNDLRTPSDKKGGDNLALVGPYTINVLGGFVMSKV